MDLRLYNTLTRKKEAFHPLDAKNVRVYVCGPTVYDYAHIGNARPIIVFDVLYRLLRHVYGEKHVTYVRNITDVDDKINARAAEEGVSIGEVTTRTTAQFHADIDALGALRPDVEPRATDHISEMIDIIQRLIGGSFAYAAEGHVLFSPSAMNAADGMLPRYGALSNRSLDDMLAGARVDVAPYKRDAMDFVLWKPSTADLPGWDSPWGRGRPGWHIECSAMSWKHLGERFDIHGGGIDLVFPHHENEIAQSCCAFGSSTMANVWMHNGFLQVEGEKMSKSLGNFVTVNELLTMESFGGRSWLGDVLRLAMLKTHYRQPIDWTAKGLEAAQFEWKNFGDIVRDNVAAPKIDSEFVSRLGDDLNTPAALARLHELKSSTEVDAGSRIAGSLQLLGLFTNAFGLKKAISIPAAPEDATPGIMLPEIARLSGDYDLSVIVQHLRDKSDNRLTDTIGFLERFSTGTVVKDIRPLLSKRDALDSLTTQRADARAAKDWAEADRIRDELDKLGVLLKDAKDPATGELVTTWEVKR